MVTAVSELLYQPFDPDTVANPYPVWEKLRETAPVYFHPELRKWMVFRHADVTALAKDERLSNNVLHAEVERIPGLPNVSVRDTPMGATMLFMDPPDHTRLRSIGVRVFAPENIRNLETRFLEIASALAERLPLDRDVNLVEAFNFPFPMQVICEFMGIPQGDRARFRGWSEAITQMVIQPNPTQAIAMAAGGAIRDMFEYFRSFVDGHPATGEDFVSLLLRERKPGGLESELELLAYLSLVLIAGHETSVNQIGNAVIALAKHPDRLEELRSHPELLDAAVEELLRFDPSIPFMTRLATADIRVRETLIRRGDLVMLGLGAANHDPLIVETPHRLDFGRIPVPHVTFGYGIHFCLGAYLARTELRIALRVLLPKMKQIQLTEAPLRWKQALGHRGVVSLGVRLGA